MTRWMALIEGLEGSGTPLLHTSGSGVIADNARGDYASNQIFEDDSPFTYVLEKAHRAAIDQLVRDAAQRKPLFNSPRLQVVGNRVLTLLDLKS